VAGVTLCLQDKDGQTLTARTDASGSYRFSAIRQGVYTLRGELTGYGNTTVVTVVLGQTESKTIDLALEIAKASTAQTSATRPEFFDEPRFTVAGVTDTTNLGGHGSDAIVRNRAALAQAAVSLSKQTPANSPSVSPDPAKEKSLREAVERQPGSFDANYELGRFLVDESKAGDGLSYLERASRLNPGSYDDAYELALAYADTSDYDRARKNVRALLASGQERAELHHLLGDVEERLGNPLEAVREYQRAAELNPSESNLFDWGAELLAHRAAEPSIEVFAQGNRMFPRSVRMLIGLGASQYSLGSNEQAAHNLCDASDLNPDDPNPYLLMGKMQAVGTVQSEAIVERLGRFLKLQPQNALANYYYAVSLWKRRKSPEDVEDLPQVKSLLEQAIHLDPKLGPAYLQLGVLYSERKDFSSAISAYQQAIEATPGLEEAHYRLAQAYRQAGETSKAQAELQRYTQISKEKEEGIEHQRHELQQFVYQLRGTTSAPPQ
jgi:tetratricopeptide (TPR) repeat protein